MLVVEFILLVVFLGLLVMVFNKKPKGLPPGEWGWPILGVLMPSGVSMEDHAKSLQKKYGDIFTWRLGSRTMVFLNNFTLIKSAFSNPVLQDRPDFYTLDAFSNFKKQGLVNSNGIVWHNSRRFALRQLRELGVGKSSLMDSMQYEAAILVKDFQEHVDTPQPIPWSLNVAILNVIWQLTADVRFQVDDPKVNEFNALITRSFLQSQGANLVFDMYPWLEYVAPKFIRKRLGIEDMLNTFGDIQKYMMSVIAEHEATLDPNNLRDYIDRYLVEMAGQRDDPNSTMSYEGLCVQMADIFTAGSESSTQTLRWVILHLAKYPEVQARCQREIDAAVPRDTLPGLEHKANLPYLDAVLLEVHRFVSLAPLGLVHSATEDTELGGYKIPKNTILVPNLGMCHQDPHYWSHPDQFYPDHFLDKEGKCQARKESYLPFSIGRRVCPGEGLARMEQYIFMSALLQNFTFSVPDGKELVLEKDPDAILFNFPKDLEIVIRKR
ncbi:hypothetical protein Pcinc_012595 [Petrolisthes cinctipes]|uniref:Cytochrome P450 n=1 Tax=Petrolisthes cinctipes TaxID=88211 RepID=A0AAE1FYQ2_PETCI|nr:hypothetical protein Pcinc_012595 [Petrolisthes cinctipes]